MHDLGFKKDNNRYLHKWKGVQLCREADCEKYVKRGSKCKSHGGGNRCPNCINWPDSRCGWDKYEGYCATLF